MTGLELLEGLSFVDERYIAEAENAHRKQGAPWMKVLSVAACLCILLVGALAYKGLLYSGTTESCADTAASVSEAVPETMAACDTEEAGQEEPASPAEQAAGEQHRVPYAALRIVSVEDDRWVAVVEEVSDESAVFAVGMQVTVVIDTGSASKADKEDRSMYGGILLPEEGLLAKIENGIYDADANILYVTGAVLEELPA